MTARRSLLWIFGSSVVVVVFLFKLYAVLQGTKDAMALWRCDFTNLWAGGRLVGDQAYTALYDAGTFQKWQWERFGDVGVRVFSYPPTVFLLAQLVSLPPYRVALILWLTTTGGLFIWAARKWWPTGGGPVWLAVLTPAALFNMNIGQFGFFFGALWLFVFATLDKRPLLAGALVGLFTIKPQLALLIPLLFALKGNWRTFGAAAASSIACVALTVMVYGIEPWQEFLGTAALRQASFIDGGNRFFVNLSTSTVTVVHQWTGSWVIAWAAHAAMASWTLWVVVSAARRGASTAQLAMLGATATFLILPYGLSYDLVVPAIAAWAIVIDRRAERDTRLLAAIGFVAPQVAILISAFAMPILPFALAAQLYAQHRMMRRPTDRAARASAGAMHSA